MSLKTNKREMYLVIPSHSPGNEWWGGGGAELVDEVDPHCLSERMDHAILMKPDRLQFFGDWWRRAGQIPGWDKSGIFVKGLTVEVVSDSATDKEVRERAEAVDKMVSDAVDAVQAVVQSVRDSNGQPS